MGILASSIIQITSARYSRDGTQDSGGGIEDRAGGRRGPHPRIISPYPLYNAHKEHDL